MFAHLHKTGLIGALQTCCFQQSCRVAKMHHPSFLSRTVSGNSTSMGYWMTAGFRTMTARCNRCILPKLIPVKNLRSFSATKHTKHLKGMLSSSRPWLVSHLRKFLSTEASKVTQQKVTSPTKKLKTSEIRRLLHLAAPEKYRLAVAIACLMVSSASMMVLPFGIGKIIDLIYTKDDRSDMVPKLRNLCLVLLSIFICGAIANFGRVYLMQSSGNRVVRRMREVLFGSIIRQEIGFFDKTKSGELINRLSNDTSLVGQSVTMNISDGLRGVAQAVGGVSMMIYMSPKLAMIALSIVPPVVLMSRIYGRYVQKITKNVQDSLADATQVAEERLSNMRTVRAFAQERKEIALYNTQIENVLNLSFKEAFARGIFWASTSLSGNVMILTLFYTGGIMMNESQISVGELSSFLLYAAFVGASVGGMTTFYTEMMRGLGASARLWELIDRKPQIPTADGFVPNQSMDGSVEFKGVHFSYPERSDMPVLNEFDLSVAKGQVMAVVGPSGSGKSTIAALILRYYDPQQGQLLIDGHDVRDLNPDWLRMHMGVVSQEPILFSSSISENIAYGSIEPQSCSSAKIVEAAKMANAYNFIQEFPNGFDTLVGERGIMLSGGQKQRIAIARAILKDPRILLLDEATSALDAESEYLVQEALERIMVGRTVITIAHRLSTIKNADRIAVLNEGKIVEVGTYEELNSIPNGMFRKLVERQTIAS